ncbi:MAG: choice-of-anchor J domain-containing protein [Bacteroidales bacterium]|nr:choice-of-anchor J domain-containing protein [Bacteroidales bacterium]
MKKTFQFLALAFAALCFAACEDVPAPYNIFSEGAGQGTGSHLPYTVTFESSLGDFTTENTVGDFPWTCQHSCAQITSYIDTDGDGTKENNPATSWLISPAFDLTGVEAAHVSFDYILRYANASDLATNYQVLVSKDYTKDAGVAAASWTVLPLDLVQVSDWDTWTNTGNLNIPAEFCNTANVTIALRYIAQAKAATWEVKNFVLDQGAGDQGAGDNGGGSGEEGGVKTLPYSEEFSTTLGGFKNYTTSGEGAWTIDYSTAKATGYDNASKVTTAGTYYLVSPEISLAGQTAVHVSYEYILRYNKGDENQQVFITDAFNEATPAEGWTLLVDKHTEGTDWTTFAKEDIAIPAAYLGKTVRIAFRYNTNAESGSTWEVKNFAIAAGAPGEGGNTGGEGGGSVDTPITNDYITVTAASFGLENQEAVTELKLSDGTTLTFDGGGNTNPPKYYKAGNNIRMYPKNTMTISASKKIAAVVLNVDKYNGDICNASGDITANPGSVSTSEQVVTISNVNATSTVITNTSTTTGPKSQIRWVSLTVYYVE